MLINRLNCVGVCFSNCIVNYCKAVKLLLAGLLIWGGIFTGLDAAAEFKLNKDDHVSFIGNNLADRMQHDGWLETLIQARYPEHELVFRNLGFPGDELTKRPRSSNFGSADEWLTKCKTDVVFAFFGYAESFGGERGVEGFRKNLEKFIDHTRSQQYNGKSNARLVLISPIAHEDLDSRVLPDGKENNQRLALYTKAMKEVAETKGVPLVDLFNATKKLYSQYDAALTMNGVHLNTEGNKAIAEVIVGSLFGESSAKLNESQIEKLRQAVVDKNFHWFSRYRTVDGYNVYGGRSRLNWHGQSNADVMQREMAIFDVMTSNRDKRVWAVAKGGDMKVDDSNIPQPLKVKTNRPGPKPDGGYPYVSGEAGIAKMTVHKGMQVNLFADEERFPELVNPVQISVDTDERLWVATWPTYPHWNPTKPRNDKLVILPDEDRDGRADRMIVFADGLNSVTGFEFWGGGVLVAAAPEIWFLKDTDGDDKADLKIRMLQGLSSADSHHTANALVIGPDGGLYYSRGVFHVTNMETPTKIFRSTSSGVYRFDPRTFEIDFHHPIGPNPHGDVIDQWGYQFVSDGTSGTGSYVSIGKGVGPYKQWYKKRVRPVPATGLLSSEHFPTELEGNFMICNAIGFLGILQYEVKYNGSEVLSEEVEPIVYSSDPNFRPSDVEIGGDGALYIADWHNALIGHMQHNIRDPNRDDKHGRIYRVTYEGNPLLKPVKRRGKPVEQVLETFHSRTDSVRYRTRLELSGRDTDEVVKKTNSWTDQMDVKNPAHEQPLLEALWVFEEHRVPNEALLRKVYQAKEEKVRAAAIRTLGHWGSKVKGWEEILLAGARDKSALVRAEAVKASVSFEGIVAAEAIFEVATRETDPHMDYVLNYARGQMKTDAMVQDAVKKELPLSVAAQKYAVQKASVKTLLMMKPTEVVDLALIHRAGVPVSDRENAIARLAKRNKITQVRQLVNVISEGDKQMSAGLGDLLAMLSEVPKDQLGEVKDDLLTLSAQSSDGVTRQKVYGVLLNMIEAKQVWEQALKSTGHLSDLLRVLETPANAVHLTALYDNVRGLALKMPAGLKAGGVNTGSEQMTVDYYSPARKTAKVEVYESGKPQMSGFAKMFRMDESPSKNGDNFMLVFKGSIAVPRSGQYDFYIASDDGSMLYVDGKVVINHDGLHGMSEKSGRVNLTAGAHEIVVGYFDNGGGDGLKVSWKGPGFDKQEIPASVLGGVNQKDIQDQAMMLVASTLGNDKQKIDDFTGVIKKGKHVQSGLIGLGSVLRSELERLISKEDAREVGTVLVSYAEQVPIAKRELPEYAIIVGLGESLGDVLGDSKFKLKVAQLRASIPSAIDPKIMALGREVYFREAHCGTCHQANGKGIVNIYPPINDSPWITGSEERLIRIALHGLWGEIEVNGVKYSSPPLPPMTPFKDLLNDEEMAAVLTYVRNSWSNRGGLIKPDTVKRVRAETKDRSLFWKPEELLKLYPMEKKK